MAAGFHTFREKKQEKFQAYCHALASDNRDSAADELEKLVMQHNI